MKFPVRMSITWLSSTVAALALTLPLASVADTTPAAGALRDGQHDFDFDIGVWRTHIQRTLDPLSGATHSIELNGTVILDADLSKVKEFMANSPHPGKDRTSGYFGFAGHGDPVEFRNVSIKTLD